MTSNAHPGTAIPGSLRSADGKGVVRIEDRYDTGIDDLWSAISVSSGRSPSSKPLTLPPLVVAVSCPMGCLCDAVAVTSPLSLSDWKLASAWPMSN